MSLISINQSQANDVCYLKKTKHKHCFTYFKKTNLNQMMSPISKNQSQTNDFT